MTCHFALVLALALLVGWAHPAKSMPAEDQQLDELPQQMEGLLEEIEELIDEEDKGRADELEKQSYMDEFDAENNGASMGEYQKDNELWVDENHERGISVNLDQEPWVDGVDEDTLEEWREGYRTEHAQEIHAEKQLEEVRSTECVFPWTYKGKSYVSCSHAGWSYAWCSKTSNYVSGSGWKKCDRDELKLHSPGAKCIFPFTYRRKTYDKCTSYYAKYPWCSLLPALGAEKLGIGWRYCDNDDLNPQPSQPHPCLGQLTCPSQKPGTCVAWGDPHYITFDNRRHDFQGTCKYTLVRHADFRVAVRNVHRGWNRRVAYCDHVEVIVHGYKIEILSGSEVLVNGYRRSLPACLNQKVAISISGLNVLVQTSHCFSLTFGSRRVEIRVPDSYKGQLSGMCGNYNGQPNDDNLMPDGQVASTSLLYGNSWIALHDHTCPDTRPQDNFDSKDISSGDRQKYLHPTKCGLLTAPNGPFRSCHTTLSPSQYVETCVFDMAAAQGDQDMLCKNLQAYADACVSAGGKPGQWRRSGFCEVPCQPHSHYSQCATACPRTCADSGTGPRPCTKNCVESCVCDNGYVLSGTKCVPLNSCGCSKDGNLYEKNEVWKSGSRICTCLPTRRIQCDRSTGCKSPLDLFLLLDGSGSVKTDNFEKVKQFSVDVVNSFDVSSTATRVGLVQYSDGKNLVFNLGDKADKASTVSAIQGVAYQKGGTKTGAAMQFVGQKAAWRGGNVPKVLIVVTDGESYDSVTAAAQNLAADGVKVYAIGVGGFDHKELLQIANNDQDNVIELTDFNALATKIDEIATAVCTYPSEGTSWNPIEGSLSFVSIGFCGVWGVNTAGEVLYRVGTYGNEKAPGTEWLKVSGNVKLVHISSGKGIVWGITAKYRVYVRIGITAQRPQGTGWTEIRGIGLKSVCVSGYYVWGVTTTGKVYYRTGVTAGKLTGTRWTMLRGTAIRGLSYVAIGYAGVWGVTSSGAIWYRSGTYGGKGSAGTRWVQVTGSLVSISVGYNVVWGVSAIRQVFIRIGITAQTPLGTAWRMVGGSLTQIYVSSPSNRVWGCGPSYHIYIRIGITWRPPAPPPSPEITCHSKADIHFLVDGSKSVKTRNFPSVRQFILKLAAGFEIGPNKARIGVYQFAKDMRTEFKMNQYNDRGAVLNAIKKIEFMNKGQTRTGSSLKAVYNEFTKANGARDDATKVIILLTDGKATDQVRAPAQYVKNKGARVFAVGVAKYKMDELKLMASKDDYVATAKDFGDLDRIRDTVLKGVCNAEKGKRNIGAEVENGLQYLKRTAVELRDELEGQKNLGLETLQTETGERAVMHLREILDSMSELTTDAIEQGEEAAQEVSLVLNVIDQKLQEVRDLPDIRDELEDVQDLPEPDGLEDVQDLPEPDGLEDVQDLPEPDGLEDVQDLPEPGGLEDVQDLPEPGGLEDVQDLPEPDGLEDVRDLPEPDGLEDVQDLSEPDGLEDVQDLSEPDGLEDVQDLSEPDGLEDVQDLPEPDGLEDVQDLSEPDGLEEAEEFEEVLKEFEEKIGG
ncbi:ZAN [Branchiostoma lanceolatum]|uniref:ZAN protein n=1 Tax=Branchiostoma lanceolatum TaxID=7740 RepID=A0A8K0EJL5_BRALA|nr:ZAN [Branchiostoma lanceolatum]